MWTFQSTTNTWNRIAGSSLNSMDALGVYGSKRVTSTNNIPGSRSSSPLVIDHQRNVIYFFGGMGVDSTGAQGYLNDLWKFDISSREFTWISGDQIVNQNAIVSSTTNYGIFDSTNNPSARSQHLLLIDASGDLWVFGGYGMDNMGVPSCLNDLWKFSVSKNQWAWMSGSLARTPTEVYGIPWTPSSNNRIGARMSHSGSINAQLGIIYVYGGQNLDIGSSDKGWWC